MQPLRQGEAGFLSKKVHVSPAEGGFPALPPSRALRQKRSSRGRRFHEEGLTPVCCLNQRAK